MNSRIEAAVLNVCYNQATVDFTKTVRLGEFVHHAASGYFNLFVLAPECLLPEPGRLGSPPTEEIAKAVWSTKKHHVEPLVVLGSSPEDQTRLFEAGADATVPLMPFRGEEFSTVVRRLLRLPQVVAEESSASWSLVGFFLRGLHRLKKA